MQQDRSDLDVKKTEEEQRVAHEANRRSWNLATRAHNSHKCDQAAFLLAGGSTLFPEEQELIGDLTGKTLLHLLCNSGQDTLSLAKLGLAQATGVDISDEAISFATQLAKDSKLDHLVDFHRADVLDWLPRALTAGHSYDRVFMSYGVLCWLSDLRALINGIAGVLAPGGRFVLVEFHPVATMFDEKGAMVCPYSSGGRGIVYKEGVGDYVGQSQGELTPSGWKDGYNNFSNTESSHEFCWGVGDVLGAVLDAGLIINRFHEWPYSNGWQPYSSGMRPLGNRRYLPPESFSNIPLMYGLMASKK